MKKVFSLLVIALVCVYAQGQTRYVGGDISMLPRFEQDASGYKDVKGQKINDLIPWCVNTCGWNTFRVRLFVDPNPDFGKNHNYKGVAGKDYAICQDLAYVTTLGKRIKDAGAFFMLDFHYSDFWVDAGKILPPDAWQGLNDSLMADTLGKYTHMVLQTLKAAGATPDLVQVGNEIMYGLCGIQVHPYDNSGDNWTGYIGLLKAGCNAVREECPDAQIIIHTDRPTNKNYDFYYYNKLIENGVDFDVIGLSFYPFWHVGTKTATTAEQALLPLVSAINYMRTQAPLNTKRVQIVETAYNFQYWPSEGVNYDTQNIWPCSVQGQYNFVKDLVDALKPLENVDGISYWFPEDLGNGDYVNWNTKARLVEETWSNRGFWDEAVATSGHTINKTGNAGALHTAEEVCAPYYMKNFYNDTEGIEGVNSPEEPRCRKMLRNGQLLIERGGVLYAPDGIRLP